jgi:putative tryptophan/tyrosine transport system substrate-binding protein
MPVTIGRRKLLAALGGAAATWPLMARAQQPAMPVVGFLNSASPGPFARNVVAFRQGLMEAGYIDGQNVAIEYRWAEGQTDRLPAMAADLVRRQVAVIVAPDSASALAAKAASMTIPVIFLIGGDPVKLGLVATFNRPGGNITGVSVLFNTLVAKQLEALHETVPQADLIGLLVNPTNPNAESDTRDVQAAANVLGQKLVVVKGSTDSDLETVFVTLAQQRTGALVVSADPFFVSRRNKLVELAVRQTLPAIYPMRDFVVAGGLMSYGASLADGYRQVGVYAGRILKGAQPANLPVQQAVKVELTINLKTAKALGVTVPLPLLGRADEVIE